MTTHKLHILPTVKGCPAQFPYQEQLLGYKQLLTPMQNACIQVLLRELTHSQRREIRKNACALRPDMVPKLPLTELTNRISLDVVSDGENRRDRIRDCLQGLARRKLVVYEDGFVRLLLPSDLPARIATTSLGVTYRSYKLDPKSLPEDLKKLDLSQQPFELKRAEVL